MKKWLYRWQQNGEHIGTEIIAKNTSEADKIAKETFLSNLQEGDELDDWIYIHNYQTGSWGRAKIPGWMTTEQWWFQRREDRIVAFNPEA